MYRWLQKQELQSKQQAYANTLDEHCSLPRQGSYLTQRPAKPSFPGLQSSVSTSLLIFGFSAIADFIKNLILL